MVFLFKRLSVDGVACARFFPSWDFFGANLVYRCHSRLLLNIVVGVLVAEAVFLTFYQLLGLSFSGVNELQLLPRIFLNIAILISG